VCRAAFRAVPPINHDLGDLVTLAAACAPPPGDDPATPTVLEDAMDGWEAVGGVPGGGTAGVPWAAALLAAACAPAALVAPVSPVAPVAPVAPPGGSHTTTTAATSVLPGAPLGSGPIPTAWNCAVCNVTCPGPIQFKEHCAGRRHANEKYRKASLYRL